MKAKGPANDYPMVVEVGLVGSCTNSSYQDFAVLPALPVRLVRRVLR